jgi:hypothetical protein
VTSGNAERPDSSETSADRENGPFDVSGAAGQPPNDADDTRFDVQVLGQALTKAPPRDADTDALAAWIGEMCGLGLQLLLIEPDSKKPVHVRDVLSLDEWRAACKVAREAARAAKQPRWASTYAKYSIEWATSDADKVIGYLTQYRRNHGPNAPVNFAVRIEHPLVLVDCDTAEQRDAFLGEFVDGAAVSYTVTSPGACDAETGEWTHRNGGHFYFVNEGAPLAGPTNKGTITAPGDWALSTHKRYVLIPPSVRPEGEYLVTGEAYSLTDDMRAAFTALIADKRSSTGASTHRERRSPGGEADPIDTWCAETSWADLLSPEGWFHPEGRVDTCGCEVWTAPGVHADPKSATAHDEDCTLPRSGDYPPYNRNLYVWTDNPPPELVSKKTYSKLDFVAFMDHGGDRSAAMRALGIDPLHDGPFAMGDADDLDDESGEAADSEEAAAADTEEPDGLHLPEEFWTSDPVLAGIRDSARSRFNTPDAVLGVVLCRVSALMPPRVRLDTGVYSAASLHLYAFLWGDSGRGKTEAAVEAARLMPFPTRTVNLNDDPDPMDVPEDYLVPMGSADLVRVEGSFGSGQGIAAMYLDDVPMKRPGQPGRPPLVRRQVWSNVLFVTDEGASLVAQCAVKNSILGSELRAASTGKTPLGQANAKSENYRRVEAGRYTIAVVVSIQTPPLLDLLTADEQAQGTSQRFVCFNTTDPEMPDDPPRDHGPLSVTVPTGTMRLCSSLRKRVAAHILAVKRGAAVDPLDAHKDLTVARLAALVAVLCGRGSVEVGEDDWARAEMIYDCSRRIQNHVIGRDRSKRRKDKARRDKDAAERQVKVDDAVVRARAEKDQGARDRILKRLRSHGAAKFGGREGVWQKSFGSTSGYLRDDVERVWDRLVSDGEIVETAAGLFEAAE